MATIVEAVPVLESIAEQLTRISHSFQEESLAIRNTANPQHRAELAANAALIYARLIPPALAVLETWSKSIENNMRDGMSKDRFRDLVTKGEKISFMCQELIETASKACQESELLGESTEAKEARNIIYLGLSQIEILETKIVFWKKIADRKPSDIDLALIEKGIEEIRQGKFKRPEQILEELRTEMK